MSPLSMVDTIVILTICYELVTLAVAYYLVTLDIRILKKAERVDQLCKLTLRFARKRNFNRGVILGDLMKRIERVKKCTQLAKWCLLLEIIFLSIYFMPPRPDVIHISEKIIIRQNSIMMMDDIMILCGISAIWAIYYVMLVHKRNIVAHEQFSRLL